MIEGTAKDSPKRFDRNVIPETECRFANQSVTEIAAYLVAVYFAKGFFYGRYGKKRAAIEMKKRAEYKPRFNGKEN